VQSPTETSARPPDPSDRTIDRSRTAFIVVLTALAVGALLGLVLHGADPVSWVIVALVVAAVVTAAIHLRAVRAIEDRRRAEGASFARILQGLSRSVSPEAIVDAIVTDLGEATGADHVVVVRQRRDGPALEARLVSAIAGVPDSTTLLPSTDLDEPGRAVDRIAARVRSVYGLSGVTAAPLTVDGHVVGAIVLSRRLGAWPAATHGVLEQAAIEASAALSRATSHRTAEAQASTDALTGLPNRRYFDEYVSLMARRRRAGDAAGVLMVDIDKFKVLNDTHGHAVGDEVLRAVAAAIVTAVREDDVPARFGGEEFVVLLRNPDPSVAVEVGERIRAAVRGLDLRRYGVRSVSVSVGVAVDDGADGSIEDLIETADRALYRAKRAGRDRVVAA
jgi:diguanylate cyclase (GGDEF)-like protein